MLNRARQLAISNLAQDSRTLSSCVMAPVSSCPRIKVLALVIQLLMPQPCPKTVAHVHRHIVPHYIVASPGCRPSFDRAHVRAYGRFMAAISRATCGHSRSRLMSCPRSSCCSSSHFINSYTKRRCGWMITFKRRARTKQLVACKHLVLEGKSKTYYALGKLRPISFMTSAMQMVADLLTPTLQCTRVAFPSL